MKKKLKFMKRQYKRLPKSTRNVIAFEILVSISEIALFVFTLDAYHLSIVIWASLVAFLFWSFEKQERINAVRHYRIGKAYGLFFAKEKTLRELSTYNPISRMHLN